MGKDSKGKGFFAENTLREGKKKEGGARETKRKAIFSLSYFKERNNN